MFRVGGLGFGFRVLAKWFAKFGQVIMVVLGLLAAQLCEPLNRPYGHTLLSAPQFQNSSKSESGSRRLESFRPQHLKLLEALPCSSKAPPSLQALIPAGPKPSTTKP